MIDKLQADIDSVKADLESTPPEPSRKREVKKVAKKVVKKVKKVEAEEESPKAKAKAKAKGNGSAKEAKSDDDGLVTVAALAQEAQISPQSARVKLRSAELNRGEGRWKWAPGSKELKEARKVLGLS